MTLSPVRIDFVSIHAKKSAFDPTQKTAQIEALANTIVDLKGSINLPVVKQISIDEYELLSGYLEYYAYQKARENNPRLSEQIEVFVADNKNVFAIQKQLEVLQSIENTKIDQPSKSVTESSFEIDLRIRNIESSISSNQKALVNQIAQLKTELMQEIIAQLPKPVPPLEAFNRILEPEVAHQVHRKLGTGANAIVKRLQEISRDTDHKPFQSFGEIVDALKVPRKTGKNKGTPTGLISKERMLKIIDQWNG